MAPSTCAVGRGFGSVRPRCAAHQFHVCWRTTLRHGETPRTAGRSPSGGAAACSAADNRLVVQETTDEPSAHPSGQRYDLLSATFFQRNPIRAGEYSDLRERDRLRHPRPRQRHAWLAAVADCLCRALGSVKKTSRRISGPCVARWQGSNQQDLPSAGRAGRFGHFKSVASRISRIQFRLRCGSNIFPESGARTERDDHDFSLVPRSRC